MRRNKWFIWVLIIIWLATGPAVFAQAETPGTPAPDPLTDLPIASEEIPSDEGETAQFSALSDTMSLVASPLRAVLVVGEIDGVDGTWTQKEIANMELAAAELESNGVVVSRFYPPNNSWTSIAQAAQGAHFFLYRGHGISWTSGDQPLVGGIYVNGKFVSPDEIRSGLDLAQNAIVMLYSCYSAGSAGADQDLSSVEAQRRVAQYSDAFFDAGAGGYFANWYGDAFQRFIRYLFQGKTLGQAYESFYDYNAATVERYVHPDYPSYDLWLDKYTDAYGTKYNNAFAGLSGSTLVNLFPGSTMAINPASLNYYAGAGASSKTYSVAVASTGTDFSWTVSAGDNPEWVSVSPLSGVSGEALTVQLDPSGLAEGTYTTSLIVQTTTVGIGPTAKEIPIALHVQCETPVSVYLPMISSYAVH